MTRNNDSRQTMMINAARCDELYNHCFSQLFCVCDNTNTYLKSINNDAESLEGTLENFHNPHIFFFMGDRLIFVVGR